MPGTRIRWWLFGVLAGCLLTIAAFLLLRKVQFPGSPPLQTLSPPAVLKQIQQLNQLVSVKYTVQQAVGFEEKKPLLGTEKLLLFVQAEVMAGIELDKLSAADLTLAHSGALTISLPPPRILHIVIDDNQTKVWDRSITWWTPWVPFNPDLERQARLSARQAIQTAALNMGILPAARTNAEALIRQLAATLGLKEVSFPAAR